MYVGGLKLPVATSTTPPRVPPTLPHQINRESDDSRVHPSRDLNKQRPDFCYLLSSIDNLSLGRGTSTPTSSIASPARGSQAALAGPCTVLRWEGRISSLCRFCCPLGFHGPGPVSHERKAHEESILALGPSKAHLRANPSGCSIKPAPSAR